MLIFVCIFAIILEIILTSICVLKLIELDKKVIAYNEKLVLAGKTTLEVFKKINITIKNLNKFIKLITNKNLIRTLRIIRMTISIIQTIVLIKSLDLSKGLKSINYKNIKKLLMSEVIRRFIRRLAVSYIQS